MKKDEFDEILRSRNADELRKELVTLFENIKSVQDYFDFKYKRSTKSKILQRYKHEIDNALYPDFEWNNGLDIEMVGKIIDKFSKITPILSYQIELELYAIEIGNQFAHNLGGDFGEEYYVYFEELFEQTLKKCNSIHLTDAMTSRSS